MKRAVFVFLAAFVAPLLSRGASLKDFIQRGEVTEADGWTIAKTPARLTAPMGVSGNEVVIRGRVGTVSDRDGMRIVFKDPQGRSAELSLRAGDSKSGSEVFPDSHLALNFGKGWRNFFTRPNPFFYREKRLKELQPIWETFPSAAQHTFALELHRAGDGAEVWMDGRFVQALEVSLPLAQCEFSLAPGAALLEVRAEDRPETPLLPLSLGPIQRSEGFSGAEVKLADDANLPPGLTLTAGPDLPSIAIADLGRLKGEDIMADDLVSYQWRRGALDALPEARIFSVPLKTYSHAYVLCAAENDPAKAAAFTVRVTRYGQSRGEAMADSVVRLPGKNCRRVGEVRYGPPESRRTVPLWLVRVPLKNGLIQDIIHDLPKAGASPATYRYLDVELMEVLDGVDAADAFPPPLETIVRAYAPTPRTTGMDVSQLPPIKISGVHVFALALEPSTAVMTVRANTDFQVFYASDKPEWLARVEAVKPGEYTVQWQFADVEGRIAASGERKIALAVEGASETVAVPVSTGNGWYATRFLLRDAEGRDLIDHRSSFVMLPPDTRRAGFESPFGGWWFHYAHGGEPNIERVGPLLQRAGIRHTTLPPTLPEEKTAPYGITAWNIGWRDFYTVPQRWQTPGKQPTVEEAVSAHEAYIREQLALWPGINKLLIFHESGAKGAPFPSEIWGEPAVFSADAGAAADPAEEKKRESYLKGWPKRMEYLTALGKMVREKFPALKMQYGNDGSSLDLVGELLRRKMPRELVDTIAVEDLGQTFAPERALPGGLQSAWYLREVARQMGYGDVPITACHEWMGRMSRTLGYGTQADWNVRDALHALAYGFDTISIGSPHDAGGGYFFSIWGNGAMGHRYPTMAPKPSYAAVATLTRVLDCAKFQRFVPTDSNTLYAQEYRRGDDWIYALWTPREQRETRLEFADASDRNVIDIFGRESAAKGAVVEVAAATSTHYVVSKTQVSAITKGHVTFPHDAPPAKPLAVQPMEDLDSVSIVPSPTQENGSKHSPDHIPQLREGDFELRAVIDPEQGHCLELELKPHGDLWAGRHEYVMLKFKTPVVPSEAASQAGVWVKGNGGWGTIAWSVKGSSGEYLAANLLPVIWSGSSSVNFEGWNFVRYPLASDARWRSNPGVLTGLLITMPRQILYGTEMRPVSELKIRLKGACLF